MIPEIGLFLLCLALGISCLLALFPSWGAMRQDARMMAPSSGRFSFWCTPLW